MGKVTKARPGRWMQGCGIGCGVVGLLAILLTVGGSMVMMRPFREAVELRETLATRHGEVDTFTPWSDGRIPPERIDAFLQVRRAVQARCADFRDTNLQFEALDELDDQGEPGRMEILEAGWRAAAAAFGMGPLMGEFFQTRNEALSNVDMGLGEYTYIFVCAYGPTVVGPVADDPSPEESHLSTRVRETLRAQLRNQLVAMDALGGGHGGDDEGGTRRLLIEEIATLEKYPGRLPWQVTRPAALQESLAPFQERFAELYCPDSLALELTRNRRFLVGIQGD